MSFPNEPKKAVAIVPARANSKGLANKNILQLGDFMLVEHTIRVALNVSNIDKIIVSTDCPEILRLSKKYNSVLFLDRPSHLAADTSDLIDVIEHVSRVGNLSTNDIYFPILLQPTSPFRSSNEINKAIDYFTEDFKSPLIAVTKSTEHPFESILCSSSGDWDLFTNARRRQDFSAESYFISGSFYISTFENLRTNRSFFQQNSRYFITNEPLAVDIDEQKDFDLAKALLPLMKSRGYSI